MGEIAPLSIFEFRVSNFELFYILLPAKAVVVNSQTKSKYGFTEKTAKSKN